MTKTIDMVREFHDAFDVVNGVGTTAEALLLRVTLLSEEFKEVVAAAGYLSEAIYQKRGRPTINRLRENLLKELCDLQYVLDGTFLTFGFDKEAAFARVHSSNMSKLGKDGKPVLRDDGKVLKGPNYFTPNLEDLAAEYDA